MSQEFALFEGSLGAQMQDRRPQSGCEPGCVLLANEMKQLPGSCRRHRTHWRRAFSGVGAQSGLCFGRSAFLQRSPSMESKVVLSLRDTSNA